MVLLDCRAQPPQQMLDGAVAKWLPPATSVSRRSKAGHGSPIYDVEQLMQDPDAVPRLHHHRRRRRPRPDQDAKRDGAPDPERRARSGSAGGSARTTRSCTRSSLASVPKNSRKRLGRGRPLMDRSYLFAPGHNELLKVFDAGADAVMLDLEDAVPADHQGHRATTCRRDPRRPSGVGPYQCGRHRVVRRRP